MRQHLTPTCMAIASAVIIFTSCSKHKSDEPLVITPTVNPISYSVIFYLITPNDKTFNPQYYKAAKAAATSLQGWYHSQMGNKTFRVNPAVVDTLTGLHNTAWYAANNGPAISGTGTRYAYYNMWYELHQLLGSKFDSSKYTYFTYVESDIPDETIPKGLALEGLSNITGLTGTDHNKWIGAGGHALGHAFGLPEVNVTNPQAIMSTGFPLYPNCILASFEIDSLNRSPFFTIQ
jgi:hypothetical protein